MNNIYLSAKIIETVLDKDIIFSLAIHHVLDKLKEEKEDKKTASALAGCALRHYYLFNRLVDDNLPDLTKEQKYIAFSYLADLIFVNKINEKERDEYFICHLQEQDYPLDTAKVENLKKVVSDKSHLIPESINRNSIEFLSLRYNVEPWLITMWRRHFSDKNTRLILKANCKSPATYCRLNNVQAEDLIKDYPEFKKCEFDGYVRYENKNSLKKHMAYENMQVFRLSPVYKKIFENVDLDILKGIAIYGGSSISGPLIEMIVRLSSSLPVEAILSNSENYFDTQRLCHNLKLHNVNTYQASAEQILTVLSKPVHVFCVVPENTHFDLLRIYPDFSLKFKRDQIDEILMKQNVALNEASQHLDNDGYLVYIVPTLNQKEGHRMITSFLEAHKEFSLIEEEQFFPFDKYDASLYYAVMQKGENHHD